MMMRRLLGLLIVIVWCVACRPTAEPKTNYVHVVEAVAVTATPMVQPTPTLATLRHADPTGEVVTFSGQVERGQPFEEALPNGLVFRLDYYEDEHEGWRVWIGQPHQLAADFSEFVSPPYEGINGRYIEGWHFTRVNEGAIAADSFNDMIAVPQEVRWFYFVTNRADHDTAHQTLRVLLDAENRSSEVVAEAYQQREALYQGRGVLTLTDLQLRYNAEHAITTIEAMTFDVTLQFP